MSNGKLIRLDVETRSQIATDFTKVLRSRVVGQDKAVSDIVNALEVWYAGLKPPNRPIHAEILAGSSGVGKTLLAREVARLLCGSEDALLKIRGGDLSEQHAVAKLTGSPPGYIGFGGHAMLSKENRDKHLKSASNIDPKEREKILPEIQDIENKLSDLDNYIWKLLGGITREDSDRSYIKDRADKINIKFRESVKRRFELLSQLAGLKSRLTGLNVKAPVLVVLLDELEKANLTVHNFLLEILDEGSSTMSDGEVVDFRNTIFIATTNAGSGKINDIMSDKPRIGYQPLWTRDVDERDDMIYTMATKEIKRAFPGPLLNRMKIRICRPLSPESLGKIFDLEISKFREAHFDPIFIKLLIDPAVKNYIVNEATDKPEEGARLLSRKIYDNLNIQLARLKTRNELTAGDTIHITLASDGEIEFYKEAPASDGPVIKPEPLD